MGIDIHGLNFLRHAKNIKLLGDTVTIGRQGLRVIESTVKELVGTAPSYIIQPYCEELLTDYFGATKVDSIDNSDYEKATHIHNMNEALPNNLYGMYDSIIDFGCLEHIYNVPQALKNCSLLCKPGGQILHILPANNFCGHGFWQFSPELFFSLYSEINGYSKTEVFIADLSNNKKWYLVKQPNNGKRVNVTSSTELYVLVRTVLKRSDFSHSLVQQSDYVYEWGKTGATDLQTLVEPTGFKHSFTQILKKIPLVYRVLSPVYHLYFRSKLETGLNDKNPGLTAIEVESFV